MGVGLFLPGQHHADGQGEGGQIHDHGDDDIGDILVIGRQVGQLQTHDVQHGHEDTGEDHRDGVVQGQQGHGDAVEAHGRQGLIGGPIELRVAGQPVQRSAGTGQSTGNGHGQHDVALVPDTGIAGGVTVGAAGLQLIARVVLFIRMYMAMAMTMATRMPPLTWEPGKMASSPSLGVATPLKVVL